MTIVTVVVLSREASHANKEMDKQSAPRVNVVGWLVVGEQNNKKADSTHETSAVNLCTACHTPLYRYGLAVISVILILSGFFRGYF